MRRRSAVFTAGARRWNEASGDAFAAPFSEDAEFVGFDGSVTRGRKRIAEAHQELFDKWLRGDSTGRRAHNGAVPGRRRRPRCLGRRNGDAGQVRTRAGADSIQSLVATRGADGWKFVWFQNTRIRPIGANPISALLWLIPDLLWRLFVRASRTTPRKATTLAAD
jgi:hypothetical protein